MTSIIDAPVLGSAATRDHEEAAAEDVAEKAAAEQEVASRCDVFLLAGIRKLMSFRSLSHIFDMYKDGDGEEEEDDEDDIQIGFPTDVQHVTHISLDGSSSTSTNSSNVAGLVRGRGGGGLEAGACRELLSLSTNLSLEQFEFAMASLAAYRERSAVLEDRVAAPIYLCDEIESESFAPGLLT